ncbi:MAG: M23 family metallopeptidase [Bacteroides sp.]|nr:M23 family metallopeptidase [Prevotella sp.]MCM1407600.1 M23 family metallopeptidase [Treponema brennaborense]MCM1469250.1 M23 family metallopeptidase [Bacteroides sp.]
MRGERFFFIPDGKLNPTERAFFLDSSMKSPLPPGILTSGYGLRISPISGTEKFHNGIDLAAPEGTEVYACKAGIVKQTGSSPVYGKFVIIGHDERMSSFYAHLSAMHVSAGDAVSGGDVIGEVGTTGASTGPHLHFEVLSDGKGIDPVKVLGEEQIRKNGGA